MPFAKTMNVYFDNNCHESLGQRLEPRPNLESFLTFISSQAPTVDHLRDLGIPTPNFDGYFNYYTKFVDFATQA